MKNSNVPKFLKEDLPLFNAIVTDLFPNCTSEIERDQYLIQVIEEVQKMQGLSPSEHQTEKILQLNDTMQVRFGLMIIGQTLTGKSTIIRSLKHTLNHLHVKTGSQGAESYVLNPKSVSLTDLYGNFSHVTQEWTDGLASSIFRQCVDTQTPEMKWVVFDGPVDAIWVENMNTVLDDNMTLCLSNGERIKLRSDMRIFFEIDDLSQASPATVSRCGMVYASSTSLSWRQIVSSWLQKLEHNTFNEKAKEHIWNMFDNHMDNTFDLFHVKAYQQPIAQVKLAFVRSLCRLLESMLTFEMPLHSFHVDKQKKVMTRAFTYAFAWTFGGSIDSRCHSSFEVYLGNAFQSTQNEIPRTSIFDNCLYLKAPGTKDMTLEYQLWDTMLPQISAEDDQKSMSEKETRYEIVVPTKDTVRYSWLLKMNLISGRPVFLTGVSGVGKSIICQSTLQNLQRIMNYQVINLSFSSQTSAADTQRAIEDKLEKKRRNLLGGMRNARVIIFIDDVNMPAYDKYGTQMPIERLRQLIDYQGMYDIDELFWKKVQDMTFLCAAAPPEGGRRVLSQRFTSQFHMLCMPPTQEDSLQKIFGTILGSHLTSQNGFRKEVLHQTQRTVESTLLLFIKVSENLRPTPAKQLYNFSLRDIQRVVSGLCSCKSSVVSSVEKLAQLWVHESCRVYLDRLVSDEDRDWFKTQLIQIVQGTLRFNATLESMFKDQKLIFCDFLQRGLPFEDRQYQHVVNYEKLVECLHDYVEEYNVNFPMQSLSIVLFDHCIEQLLKICRSLRTTMSHTLLVGVSGSGKQTLTRLSCFISHCHFKTVHSKNRITLNDFRQSIKDALILAGVKRQRVAFMTTEYHMNAAAVENDSFLEDCSNLISHGEIANMWSAEDKEEIFRSLQYEAKEIGIYDKEVIVSRYFVERMKQKFHFVLSLSPLGENFRNRVRMFPSLMNSCQIIWFQDWPEEALYSVANQYLKQINCIRDDNIVAKLSAVAVKLNTLVIKEADAFYHQQKRKVYITCYSYLELFKTYKNLMETKQVFNDQRRSILLTGCEKLQKTNEIVIKLTKNMIAMQPQLEQAVFEATQMSRRLEAEKSEASKNRKLVEDEKKIVDSQTKDVETQYNLAKQELNSVLPTLQDAEEALNTLNQSDITELRQTKFPSKGILQTMRVTCMLLEKRQDVKKIDWRTCQQMMQAGFFDKLKGFDKDDFVQNGNLQAAVELFIVENPDFQPEIVRNASKACFNLCKWCFALTNYAKIAKLVIPKQKLVAIMEDELRRAKEELANKQALLHQEMLKLDLLEKRFNQVVQRREQLENEIDVCRQRIERSSRMTLGLRGENERWKECLKQLDDEALFAIGETFVASATINYLGPFTGVYRKRIIDGIRRELISVGITIYSDSKGIDEVLKDPIEIQSWILCGLPSDTVSIANAVIVTSTLKVPLIIDPQLQGLKWLKQLYRQKSTKDSVSMYEVRLGTKDFSISSEDAIKNGKCLLIEDIPSQLDSTLDPLLNHSYYSGPHGRVLINFGNQVIDYDKRFRLFLSTRDPNPHLLPEVSMKVAVVNFTVTEEALSEQLLSEIVRLENTELEQRRQSLSKSIVQDRIKMIQIQEEILRQLVNSSESTILDDEDLIIYLDKSKLTNQDIKFSIEDKQHAQVEIAQQRSIYEGLAQRGSILYFTIIDLSRIERMYQHSLQQFKVLFINIIESTQTGDAPQHRRIAILIKEITRIMYLNVCRGLFHDDKLIFALTLAVRIALTSKALTHQEWDFFTKGLILSAQQSVKKPENLQVSDKQWMHLISLELVHPAFAGITRNPQEWAHWVEQRGNSMMLPGDWETKLTPFQKLMVVRGIREEALIEQVKSYLRHELGEEFIVITPSVLDDAYADSDNKTPIILILEQGADPTANFGKLFHKIKARKSQSVFDQLHTISLGQGQDRYALACLEKAQNSGSWVLLQNCHLYESFMPTLERLILTLPDRCFEIHQDFRLFLTSIPCDFFPTSILQQSLKVSFEAARGIKASLLTSVMRVPDSLVKDPDSSASLQSASLFAKAQLLSYSLCFFHAVVQERRKFGSLGWNIRYEFNESDLDTGLIVIRDMMSEKQTQGGEYILWDSMQEVISEIVYGGRVTDEVDRRTLKTILKIYIASEVMDEGYLYYGSCYSPLGRSGCDLESIKGEIMGLPEMDQPEIFGMTQIADINFSIQESYKLLRMLLQIQPKTMDIKKQSETREDQAQTQDQQVEDLVRRIQSQIPQPLTREGSSKEIFVATKEGLLPSMTVFLLHEIERYNNLVTVITQSLDNLQKAIKGLAVMSEELESMYYSIYSNKVPEMWNAKAYPSLKPLSSWFQNLNERIEFLRMWLKKGNKVGAYWISGFFFPQGFLTSVLQNYARKTKSAIDSLTFTFEMLPHVHTSELPQAQLDRPPNEGVLIYGLYITSGFFNLKSGYLDEDPCDFRQYYEAPIILFRPLPERLAAHLHDSVTSSQRSEHSQGHLQNVLFYSCPLYKTSERAGTLSTTGHSTNFIISIDLPTVRDPQHWILRGTALLCQLDD